MSITLPSFLRKAVALAALTAAAVAPAVAQRFVVTGQVRNAQTKAPEEFVSAVLLRADSTAIVGAMTDEKGRFTLMARQAGRYIIKVSSVGSRTVYTNVALTAQADSVNVGTITLQSADHQLGTAVVTATVARVEQVNDTTQYNASAYRVPEGSTLEALVEQLPGVEVDDDGTIKWKGKAVTEFLINGKDFFKGDTKTAMKNLPVEIVNKIKAYDKKSDYTEMTGIDDGEETTVLDIVTKRALNESWITNVDLSMGSKDRYSAKFFLTRFTDRSRISAYGSANNINDRGFGARGRMGGGSGLVASKSGGLDFSWENGRKKREAGRFEVGGNINARHTSSDAITRTSSETFLTQGRSGSFGESFSRSGSSSTSVNSQLRLQWNPDTMTNISFRPSYSYSESKGNSMSRSATFNDDPNQIDGMYTPLDSMFVDALANSAMAAINPELLAIAINRNQNYSLSDSKSHNVSGNANFTRRLGSNGRNVSLRLQAGYQKNESNSYSLSDIKYFSGNRDGQFINQYSTSPVKNWNYGVRLGYVEPLGKQWFAELNYNYNFRYQDRDRGRYRLDSLGGAWADMVQSLAMFGTLPTIDDWMNIARDDYNSQYATYKYYNHSINVGVRYNTETVRFNAGVAINPEKTKMAYNRPGQHIDTLITRDVFTMSPQVRLRYRFSRTTNLDINYRGSSSQPSMTDLLAVVDDTNPLNISMGNPGLKPSWTDNMDLSFSTYDEDTQRTMAFRVNGQLRRNAISNRMVYDDKTGVSYRRPENINGNWSTNANFMVNTPFTWAPTFSIASHTDVGYSNEVGYISRLSDSQGNISGAVAALDGTYEGYDRIFAAANSAKNTTKNLRLNENLTLTYRHDWFDINLNGRVNYQHARASLQESANMDTWNFSYGGSFNLRLPWNMTISSDMRMSSRRGYASSTMNTNELLWNAQIAQSFLKGNAATISLQFFDILHNQSNVSRALSATSRRDSWNNSINSYFMLHVIYRLRIFPGTKSGSSSSEQSGERQRGWGRGQGGSMPAMPMGGAMGGHGGF
ncbi:MAG: outer membrane beta-barrel protein [Bacteroidales bacterium]|nr:outer membrane beta-barrel protein [Bacteroidales bacterium]